ncbi:MAG: SDR family NAD(P)-dependent oxidoreductase [Candidatus Methylacidiphilales bacterium]
MSSWAVITGASAGIGKELAEEAAKEGYRLILVARREDRLRELAADLTTRYGCECRVEVLDLAEEEGQRHLAATASEVADDLEVWINNAGFGASGRVVDLSWSRQRDMISLNMTALAFLSRHAASLMEKRGKGYIMNVASTAAFLPGPLMTMYYASKAFVLHFTEGLAEEMRASAVVVSALCPGPTESEFLEAAGMNRPIYFKGPVPTSQEVAVWGWRAMMNGKVVAVHSLKNRILTTAARLMPRMCLRRITHQLNQTR